ncbi:MAG: hypothetical protein LBR15_00625 [Methanobrevibacter sp.]|jgi:hypothetical protein|nr:hypothetical protein [Candidatus Methanovirga australis]
MSDYHYEYDNFFGDCLVSIYKGKEKIMEKLLWHCWEDWKDDEWLNIYSPYKEEDVERFKEKFKDKPCSEELLKRLGLI